MSGAQILSAYACCAGTITLMLVFALVVYCRQSTYPRFFWPAHQEKTS